MTAYTQERREQPTATIAISTTTSNAIDCLGKAIVGLSMPAAFTGTKFTLTSSRTVDGTYQAVYDLFGNQVEIAVNVSRNIETNGFLGNKFYKLVSDASEVAEREIEVTLIGI